MASLVYQHNSYYAVFSVKRKKKWIKIGRVDKKEARKVLKHLEVQYIKGKFDINDLTDSILYDFLEEYLEYSKTNKAFSTYIREKEIAGILKSHFGNVIIKSIDTKSIENYKSNRVGKGLKPATINRELTMVRFMLKKANDWHYLDKIPKVSFLKLTKNPIKFLSIIEIERLLEHSSVWLKPILIVLRNTGMRIGELLALKLNDVDIEKGNVLVRSSKTNNFRHIPINVELEDTLKWLMEYCVNPKSLKINKRHTHQKEYIFCHQDGSKVESIKHSFKKACLRADIKATIHTIRHTFASHLVMNNVDLVSIKELLGHSSISTTMIYAHVSDSHKAESVKKLPWNNQVLEK
jgi:site-specific recombinase XerD